MIDRSTVIRIIDAANIVDVVSDYVTLRRTGASYKGLCPFHDDKTPSFSVSPARNLCKCFSCGKGGSPVHFIMEMEQVSYADALRVLAKKYGIQIQERELTDEERRENSERESMFAVNEWAAKYFTDTMYNHQDGRAVGLAYFRSRGFRDDIINKFRLGFCLDSFDALAKEAKAKGYKEQFLIKTGLCVKRDNGTLYDRYRGRAIFPWISLSGRVVAFGGRVLDARTKGVSQKYVNSPDSLIFHKSNELYGIFQAKNAIARNNNVYMVEGYTDVLAMHQCGIENVVANSGTALNEAQVRMLHRLTENITLVYDGDEAGIHAANRSTDMLLLEGMNVKILLLPDGDDPDSFSRKHNAAEFKEYVDGHLTDFILFKTNVQLQQTQHDPIKRAEMTNSIVHSISLIPDEIKRLTYVHECAEVLGIEEETLMRSTNKNRRELIEKVRQEAKIAAEREALQEEMTQTQTSGLQQTADPQPVSSVQSRSTSNGQSHTAATSDVRSSHVDSHTEGQPSNDDPSYGFPPPDMPPFDPTDFPQHEEIQQGQSPTQAVGTSHASSNNVGTANTVTVPLFSHENNKELRFVGIERMIMTLIARYGEMMIDVLDVEGNTVQVSLAEYVGGDLEYDEIEFRSDLYKRMLNEVIQHVHDEGFAANRYLLYHPDIAISQETVNLLEDRYTLSSGNKMATSEAEQTPQYIGRLLLDYKNLIIDAKIQKCHSQLTQPDVKNDAERCNALLKEIMDLSYLQRDLAKRLGDRVIAR